MRSSAYLLVTSLLGMLAVGCDAAPEPDALDIELRPDIPLCTTCTITDDSQNQTYILELDIHQYYASAVITDPGLVFIDPETEDELTVSMAPMSIDPLETTEIDLSEYELDENGEVVSEWLAEHNDVTEATLSLVVDEDGSGPNPAQTKVQVISVEH